MSLRGTIHLSATALTRAILVNKSEHERQHTWTFSIAHTHTHTLTQKPVQGNTLFGGSATAAGNIFSIRTHCIQFILRSGGWRSLASEIPNCNILMERQSFILQAIRSSEASWRLRVGVFTTTQSSILQTSLILPRKLHWHIVILCCCSHALYNTACKSEKKK